MLFNLAKVPIYVFVISILYQNEMSIESTMSQKIDVQTK